MRYSFYWIPKQDTELGKIASEWFLKGEYFNSIVETHFPEYKYVDFSLALKVPAKYGFHVDIVSPFELAPGKTEADAFLLLKKIVRLFSQFDMVLRLSDKKNILYLDSQHKTSIFYDLKKEFCTKTNMFVKEKYDIENCMSPLEVILSHTNDPILHEKLHNVAKIFWKEVLQRQVKFDAVSLCYQKDFKSPFKELTRLPLKMVY